MYKLTFVYFYQLTKRINPDPRLVAVSLLSTTVLFHFAFLLGALRFIFDFILPRFDESFILNKIYLIPIAILWLLLFELFFSKKSTDKILDSFSDTQKVVTLKNTVLIILFIFAPLVLGILLFNLS